MLKLLFFVLIFVLPTLFYSQTLIINEFSNGPAGTQEYIEFIVVDDNAFYDCGNSAPPCVDIRGWIIDDNSGYHGTGGVAAGCNRFSNDPFWQCIPIGTIITVYNDADRNGSLPPDDLLMSDNNCRLIIPINNTQLFDNNTTTPGAVACSYPATGWTAGGNWTRIGMANTGDCARLVNLAGCEVSSLCYGDVNLNTQVYFLGNGSDNVWSFSDGSSTLQANWAEGCADNETLLDAGTCGANNQTPGVANNSLNSAYIAQFNNNCQPILPLSLTVIGTTSQTCFCDGSASISASGSIGPYTYAWYDQFNIPLGQTNSTANNLCSGNYYCVVTSSIDCKDTIPVFVGSICSNFGTFASATMIQNCVNNQFYNTTWANLPDQINPSGVLFDAYDYGPYFQNSNTLILRGGEVKTFKNPGANVCGAKLNYTIYTVGNQPTNPVFTVLDLPFKESCNVGLNSFPTGGPCFNATDQKWAKENYNIDLTTLAPGNYVLEVYYSVPGSFASTTACNDTIYVNNNGMNYKALFQIKPTPNISASSLNICPGNNATLTSNYATGNSWTGGSTSQSITVNTSGTTTLTVNLNNNCPNQTDTETINIYAPPTVEAGANQSTCGTNAVTLSGVIGGSATGSQWISPSGTFSNANSLNTTFTPSITSGVATVILSATGPCPTVQDQLVILVNATPTVNAGLDQTICAGNSINISGTYGGSANASSWSAPSGTFGNSTNLSTTYIPTITSGTVTLTLSASGPCPTVNDQLILTVNPIATSDAGIDQSICAGASVNLSGSIAGGAFSGTWSGGTGTFIPNSNSLNATYTPSASEISTGTITLSLTTNDPNGPCNSESDLISISINPFHSTIISESVCPSQIPYTWNGLTFSGPGSQTANLTNINGCDSSVTLNLSVSNIITSNTSLTICPTELPYSWNGLIFNSAGSQSISLTSSSGCDSIATLNLSVSTPQSSTSSLTICYNQLPYSWNGLVFNNSGSQTVILQDINGCDSSATLNLQVQNTLTSTTTMAICPIELPYSWNNIVLNGAGTQSVTLTSAGGCDSIATIVLSINPTYNTNEIVTICENETPFSWNGLTFSNTTTQSLTLQTVNGCDSVVTLNLTVLPSTLINLDSTICSDLLPFTWNGLIFSAAGTQSVSLTDINGCDSTITYYLAVNSLPQIISFGGGNQYCEGDAINDITAQLNGTGPYTLSFTYNGSNISITSSSGQFNLGNLPGNYTINSISDLNCQNDINDQTEIIQVNPIPLLPIASSDAEYCLNIEPNSITVNGNLNAIFFWYNNPNLSNVIGQGSSYVPLSNQGTTTYYVVQQENGCLSTPDSVLVTFNICDIIIPTAFTPDNDNVNDSWSLTGIDLLYPKNVVTIYNRWGNVIFQSEPGTYELSPWNGTYNNEQMPVGSYYFIIEYGETFKQNQTGIVTIIQ